jgi:Response regulator of the LytR/AlgR family
MKIINTVIIDDQHSCVEALQNDLKNYENILLTGSFTSAVGALSFVKVNMPDLLFLDMEMSVMNGIEFLQEIADFTKNKNMCVVFYTAHDYKMEAIRHSAFDYLQKPYTTQELDTIIERVAGKLVNQKLNIRQEIEHLTEKTGLIALNAENGHLIVKVSQVVYFEYDGKVKRQWRVILADNSCYLLKYATKGDEILRVNNNFFQSTQHHIINMNFLFSINKEKKKHYCVFYPPFNELKIEISAKYYPLLKDKLSFI